MWTFRTARLVPRPAADVRAAIADLVRTTWAPFTAVTTTEHHGVRSDWIATDLEGAVLDVVLSWTLADLDDDEFDRREEASRRLAEALGRSDAVFEWALRDPIEAPPSVEVRRRAERLLAGHVSGPAMWSASRYGPPAPSPCWS